MNEITEEQAVKLYDIIMIRAENWQTILTKQKDPTDSEIPLIFTKIIDKEGNTLRKVLINEKDKKMYAPLYLEKDREQEIIDEGLNPDDFPIAVFDNLYKRRYEPITIRIFLQEAYDEDDAYNEEIRKFNEENPLVQRVDFIKREDMGIRIIYLSPHILKENKSLNLFTTINNKRYQVTLILSEVEKPDHKYLIPRPQSEYCYGCSFAYNQQIITANDLGLKINHKDFRGEILSYNCDVDICEKFKEFIGDRIIKVINK